MRVFMKVSSEVSNERVVIPQRKTEFSAGYDFTSPITVTIRPGSTQLIRTGIKAYMGDNEYLQLAIRSSLAAKKLACPYGVGIIDADYADNTDNEGNIGFLITNFGREPYLIRCGDRIGQGIFLPYFLTDDDDEYEKATRTGPSGSTGR